VIVRKAKWPPPSRYDPSLESSDHSGGATFAAAINSWVTFPISLMLPRYCIRRLI